MSPFGKDLLNLLSTRKSKEIPIILSNAVLFLIPSKMVFFYIMSPPEGVNDTKYACLRVKVKLDAGKNKMYIFTKN